LITAWLLIVQLTQTTTITIPGIASEIECESLASRVAMDISKTPVHRCISYQAISPKAEPPNVFVIPSPDAARSN
jgi:hypothetical protein